MSQAELREVECPRCQGTVTVLDSPIYSQQQSEPTGWIIERAVCENGCELESNEIPRRPA